MTLRKKAFENIVGKGENVGNQLKFQFLGYIYFVVCKYFQFGRVLKFVVWYRVNIKAISGLK